MSRIVVVDDDPDTLKPILIRLKDAGYEAGGFSDARAGWEAIQAAPPDLIVLDRKMPLLSGDLIQKKPGRDLRLCGKNPRPAAGGGRLHHEAL